MEIEKHSAADQNEDKIIKKNSNRLSIDLKKTTTTTEKYRRPSIVGSVSSSHNSNAATSGDLSHSS